MDYNSFCLMNGMRKYTGVALVILNPPKREQSQGVLKARREVGLCLNSGCRREVHENCVLLGYYAASSGDSLQKFRDNL